jgi:hypothetical protein
VTDHDEQLRAVQHMIARERLSLDEPAPDRTCFLSHVGAQARLVPGPWIGHRDLIYAMALANLSPTQRTSLARAVLVEHGREFGVGRLRLVTSSSGLPLGGSNVRLEHRQGGPVCLYTWALGVAPTVVEHEWMLLRAQPEWALADPPRPLSVAGLETLAALGGEVVVLVPSAVEAVQIAQLCAGRVEVAAHPRFAPYIEGLQPEASVLLWPQDALEGTGLRRHEVMAVVSVGAAEATRQAVARWADGHGPRAVEVVDAACPGRLDRPRLAAYWQACGRPRVLLRGDSGWATAGAAWLADLGARVDVQGRATQLSLI